MDNHLLVAASNAKKAVDKPRTPEAAVVDGDAFSRLLNEKINDDDKDKVKDKDNEIVQGKEPKKGSAQEAKAAEDRFRQHMGLQREPMVGTRNYMFNLALRDPATLNISERQSLHLGEFSRGHLELKDIQQALADRGLQLKDLSFSQIAQVSRSHSKDELADRLDHLDLSKPEAGTGAGATGSALRGSQTVQSGQQLSANVRVDLSGGAIPAGLAGARPVDATEARKLQRENVIKQILQHIDVTKLANSTEVALKLNPAFLGDMRIKLNFEGGGHIGADFETTSKDTRDLIDEGLDSLKSSFSRSGMTLTRAQTHLVESVT